MYSKEKIQGMKGQIMPDGLIHAPNGKMYFPNGDEAKGVNYF